MLVAAYIIVAALTDYGTDGISVVPFVVYLLGLGLLFGSPPGLVVGLIVGAIIGSFRDRFDALWPITAAAIFLLTFVLGSIFSFINGFLIQEDPTKWGHALVGCAWALGGGVGFAIAGGLASIGVYGSKSGSTVP